MINELSFKPLDKQVSKPPKPGTMFIQYSSISELHYSLSPQAIVCVKCVESQQALTISHNTFSWRAFLNRLAKLAVVHRTVETLFAPTGFGRYGVVWTSTVEAFTCN